jgi:hypothetical protein
MRKPKTQPAGPLRPGASVRVRIAMGLFPAVVLEDRGAFAQGEEHIFRVAIYPDDPDQRAEFEVSEEEIESLAA